MLLGPSRAVDPTGHDGTCSPPNGQNVGVDDRIEQLEANLTDPALADRVEMVVRPAGPDTYRAAAVDGAVTFRRRAEDGRYAYEVLEVAGRDPLADQSTDHLLGHDAERSHAHPARTANAYPHAFDSVAQFFDAPHAPDLVITHTAAHMTDGHLGQHGSLGTVQARAPFIAAGAGVASLGTVERSTRVVDVAPTIAALLQLDPHPRGRGPTGEPRADALLARQDGDPISDVLDGHRAEHVVVLLLDGCNANLLHDAIDAGEAPHIAGLVARGTDFRHGAYASLPTATLANHTTAVTGAHPGHSGVLHNTWLDRGDSSVPDLLAFDQMFWAMRHLSPEVETLFQAVARSRPGAFSSASFEFCDTGATWSSFADVRDGVGGDLPPLEEVTHLDPAAAERSEAYRFMSRVDHLSVLHTLDAWSGTGGAPLPTLSWCGLAVTDEAGHESGPHGELARAAVRDSDARVGEVLAAVERAGALERTAVVVIADHGMEQADPSVDRDWASDLAATGIGCRDIGGGLVYLDRS
jgi:phosphonoacetate hydrolase